MRALLIALAIIVTACGAAQAESAADSNEPAATSAPAQDSAPATTEATSTDTEPPVEEPTETQPTVTEPQAPQSVTASTVHETSTDDFPDILAAQATPDGDGTWRFDVTVSSTYDTPQRYADAWRVVGPDGAELGIRVLTHDHANEQPFTRSQSGIAIPADITQVTVEGRDQANGWGGGSLVVDLTAGS